MDVKEYYNRGDKTFEQEDYTEHKDQYHDDDIKCENCGKIFKYERELEVHLEKFCSRKNFFGLLVMSIIA